MDRYHIIFAIIFAIILLLGVLLGVGFWIKYISPTADLADLDNMGIKQLLETHAAEFYPGIQIPGKFEELYKEITGEDKPDNVGLVVLPIEAYLKHYEYIRKRKLTLLKDLEELKKETAYIGGVEFTVFDDKYGESIVVVLQNREDLLLEAVSRGIGHLKYNRTHRKIWSR